VKLLPLLLDRVEEHKIKALRFVSIARVVDAKLQNLKAL